MSTKNIRILIYLLLFTFLFAVVFIFLTSKERRHFIDALHLVPNDATIVLRLPSVEKWIRTIESTDMGKAFTRDKGNADLLSNVRYIFDSIVSPNEILRNAFQQSLILSFTLISNDLKPLFAVNIPQDVSSSDLKESLRTLWSKQKYKIVEEAYDGEVIHAFIRKETTEFYAILYHQTLLLSTSRIVIEQAIRQSKVSATLIFNKDFINAQSAVGSNVDGNLFFRVEYFSEQFAPYINKDFIESAKNINEMGTWLSLDITFKNESVYLTGFLYPKKKGLPTVEVFKRQPDRTTDVLKAIPQQAKILFIQQIKHYNDILNSNKTLRNSTTAAGKKFTQLNQKLSEQLGEEVDTYLSSIDIESMASVFVPMEESKFTDQWFTVIKLNSAQKTEQQFMTKVERFAKQQNLKLSTFILTEKMRNLEKTTFYKNPFEGLFSNNAGRAFKFCEEKYCVFIGDYWVFSSSKEDLKDYILNTYQKKTLLQSPATWTVDEVFGLPSTITFALNPAGIQWKGLPFFTPDFQQKLAESAWLKNVRTVVLQLRNSSEQRMYCNIEMQLAGEQKIVTDDNAEQGKTHRQWSTELSYPVQSQPQIVRNFHTQNYQIWLQDINNNLILLDHNGKLLWKYPLQEQITSKVTTVDFLKNGKQQYLFSTLSQIHLVDRLGTKVAPFPVALPATSQNGMAVFDYNKNREYRYFLSGDNGNIYALDKYGKKLDGFKAQVSDKTSTNELRYFTKNNKDYIQFTTEPFLYLMNRKGEVRLKVATDRLGLRSQHIMFDDKNNLFVGSTNEGEVWKCDLSGKVSVEKYPVEVSKNHYMLPYFQGNQLNYLLYDNTKVYILDSRLKIIAEKKLDFSVTRLPECFVYKNQPYFLLYSQSSAQAIVLNRQLDKVDGFPVDCTAPLSVTNLLQKGKLQVIIPSQEPSIVCYTIDH